MGGGGRGGDPRMMGTVEDTYDVRRGEGRYHLSCLIIYYPIYSSPAPEFLLRRE